MCACRNTEHIAIDNTASMLTQTLMLQFKAMQKAGKLITAFFKFKFLLNVPEKVDLKIHWQEHSSHSISGSPPE